MHRQIVLFLLNKWSLHWMSFDMRNVLCSANSSFFFFFKQICKFLKKNSFERSRINSIGKLQCTWKHCGKNTSVWQRNAFWNFRYLHCCLFKWTILNTLSTIMLGECVYFVIRCVLFFYFFFASLKNFWLTAFCLLETLAICPVLHITYRSSLTLLIHELVAGDAFWFIHQHLDSFTFNIFPSIEWLATFPNDFLTVVEKCHETLHFHSHWRIKCKQLKNDFILWIHNTSTWLYGRCYSDQANHLYRNAPLLFFDSVRQLI